VTIETAVERMSREILRLGTFKELMAYINGMAIAAGCVPWYRDGDGGSPDWLKLYGEAFRFPEVKAHIEELAAQNALDILLTKE